MAMFSLTAPFARSDTETRVASESVEQPYGPSALTPSDLPIRQMLIALRRRWRLIAVFVVAVTAIALGVGLNLPKKYTATTTILMEPGENQIVGIQQVMPRLSMQDRGVLQTQIDLITSRPTLGYAVDRYDLAPALIPAAELSGLSSSLVRERAISEIQSELEVEAHSKDSYALSISFTSTRPELAAKIANIVAESYLQFQEQQRLDVTGGAVKWLAIQVEEMRSRVLQSEQVVEAFRAKNGLPRTAAGSLDDQQAGILTSQLIATRAERTAAEAKLRQVRELGSSKGGFEAVSGMLSSQIVLALRQRELELQREEALLAHEYGERHPRIVHLRAEQRNIAEKIDSELRNAVHNLENDLAVMRSREQALEQSLQQTTGRSALTSEAEVQLRELERQAAADRSLYETFLVRLKETETQQGVVPPDAKVISPGQTPQVPSSPPPAILAGIGFFASGFLGVLFVLLLEHMDGRIRSKRDVERWLGMPVLALVPTPSARKKLPRLARLHEYMIRRQGSAYAEGIRGLHTRVSLAEVEEPWEVILITSSLPGEGKTALSSSLAVFAAQLGQRALLVDFDLRRPTLADLFQLPPQPGVAEVLKGDASLGDAIRRHEGTGLAILTGGCPPENPTTLFASVRLNALVDDIRTHYDFTVLDAPPILGVSDAKVLALLADITVFVVQWERTREDAARHALNELQELTPNVAGVALTQVDLGRYAQGYYDAGRYYREYAKYYKN